MRIMVALGLAEWLAYRPAGVRLPPIRAAAIISPAAMLAVAMTPLPSIGDLPILKIGRAHV